MAKEPRKKESFTVQVFLIEVMIKVSQLQVTMITKDVKSRLFSNLRRLHHGTDQGCYPAISVMFDWEAAPHRRIARALPLPSAVRPHLSSKTLGIPEEVLVCYTWSRNHWQKRRLSIQPIGCIAPQRPKESEEAVAFAQ